MFAEYIDWRVAHPSDDIMTELLHVEFEDETGSASVDPPEILTYVRWWPEPVTRRRRG